VPIKKFSFYLGGGYDRWNIYPQEASLNLGRWKRLENKIKARLRTRVYSRIILFYELTYSDQYPTIPTHVTLKTHSFSVDKNNNEYESCVTRVTEENSVAKMMEAASRKRPRPEEGLTDEDLSDESGEPAPFA
jgi:hypothetical protein